MLHSRRLTGIAAFSLWLLCGHAISFGATKTLDVSVTPGAHIGAGFGEISSSFTDLMINLNASGCEFLSSAISEGGGTCIWNGPTVVSSTKHVYDLTGLSNPDQEAVYNTACSLLIMGELKIPSGEGEGAGETSPPKFDVGIVGLDIDVHSCEGVIIPGSPPEPDDPMDRQDKEEDMPNGGAFLCGGMIPGSTYPDPYEGAIPLSQAPRLHLHCSNKYAGTEDVVGNITITAGGVGVYRLDGTLISSGTPISVARNEAVDQEFAVVTNESFSSGSITASYDWVVPDEQGGAKDVVRVSAVIVDLRMQNLQEEDAPTAHELNPGAFVCLNDNDNAGGGANEPAGTGNDTSDIDDVSYTDPAAPPLAHADPDLQPIHLLLSAVPSEGVLTLTVPANVRVWKDAKKNKVSATTISSSTIAWDFANLPSGVAFPMTLYVEGIADGTGNFTLAYCQGTGDGSDIVKITTLDADLQIQGLAEETLPAPHEEYPGAYVCVNGDFDEAPFSSYPDRMTDSIDEDNDDDLVDVTLVLKGSNAVGRWQLLRPQYLRMWRQTAPGEFEEINGNPSAELITLPQTLTFKMEATYASGFLRDGNIWGYFLPEAPEAPLCGDLVKVTALELDADVDSDNTGPLAGPDRSLLEELLEELFEDFPELFEEFEEPPGKYICVNNDDVDDDGIPDFADGYDKFDATATVGEHFIPLLLEVKGISSSDLSNVRIKVGNYSYSDPNNVNLEDGAYTPAAGHLRLWTKDGNIARKHAAANTVDPPDPNFGYVVPPGEYTAAQLGFSGNTATLYLEGINPSSSLAEDVLTFELGVREVPEGGEPLATVYVCDDTVRVTVVLVDLDIDSNNDGNIAENDDPIEGNPNLPGKYLVLNDGDKDAEVGDGVPDYADGYDLIEALATDDINDNEVFYPLDLAISSAVLALDPNEATLTFSYSDSDPAAVTWEVDAQGNYEYSLPGQGHLRIWSVPGNVSRKKESIVNQEAGHYVPAGTYTLAQLNIPTSGELDLYVEAVVLSNLLSHRRIEVTLDPDGSGPIYPICADVVLTTISGVNLKVDSNNDKGINIDSKDDVIEHLPTRPGHYVVNSWQDWDHDGIPDVADGYNRDGVTGNDDDHNGSPGPPLFTRYSVMVVELSEDFLESGYVRLRYDLADPKHVERQLDEDRSAKQLPDIVTYDTHAGPDERIRIWTVFGDSERNADTLQAGGHIIDPDHVYSAAELGIYPGSPTVHLFVEGVQDSMQLGDTVIGLDAWRADPGAQPASPDATDLVRVTVGSPSSLLDTDRDTVIRWPASFTEGITVDYTHPDSQSGTLLDRTRNYRFWINDDRDGYWFFSSREGKNPLVTQEFWMDTDAETVPEAHAVGAGDPVPANYLDDIPNAHRDLEDFTRFQIRLPGYINADNASRFRLKIDLTEGMSIRMFLAIDPSRKYLYDSTTSVTQMGHSTSHDRGGVLVESATETDIPIDTYFFDVFGDFSRQADFIFEGRTAGQGRFDITLYDYADPMNPVLIDVYSEWVHLDNIENFFEQFSLGGDAAQEPNHPSHGAKDTCPDQVDGSISYPAPDATNRPWELDYILGVHGFNVGDWNKVHWYAGTMAKRLWHLGYRGRLGVMYWPSYIVETTLDGVFGYDKSDDNAWRAGIGCQKLLVDLNDAHQGAYQGHLRLYCHSQGNPVGSQALISATTATPANVGVGDIFSLTLTVTDTPMNPRNGPLPVYTNATHVVWFQATAPTVANVTAGLTAAWNAQADQDPPNIMRHIRAQDQGTHVRFVVHQNQYGALKEWPIPLSIEASATDVSGNAPTLVVGLEQGKLVDYFISTQAAISASAFDSSVPMTAYTGNPLINTYPNTPDIFGQYPGYPVPAAGNQRPYFRQLNTNYANGAAKFFRYFNPADYAVANLWEANMANRPGVDWDFVSGRFQIQIGEDPSGQPIYAYMQFTGDTLEGFSSVVEGRMGLGVSPAGTVGGLFAAQGGTFNEFDMEDAWDFDHLHPYHSAQFNGNLAAPVEEGGTTGMWEYWDHVLEVSCEILPLNRLPVEP